MHRERSRPSINVSFWFKGDATEKVILAQQAGYLENLRKRPTEELLEFFHEKHRIFLGVKMGFPPSDLDMDDWTERNEIGFTETLEDVATILVLERSCEDPMLQEFVIHEPVNQA